MMKINNKSFLLSKLDFNCYIIILIIYEKNIILFNNIKKTSYFGNSIVFLLLNQYIKYTGFTSIYDTDLELFDIILLKKSTVLFGNDYIIHKVIKTKDWITEYRLKFKGIKVGSMGDFNACLKKMEVFIKNNPKYTKETILDATDKYISNTKPIYVMDADNFISKADINRISKSKLFSVLESIELGEFEDNNKSNINTMI